MTSILFLFIYLFYTTGFHELLKANVLIEHFHESQINDAHLTFYYFLVMHYLTDDLNDKDNDRDKQLPFKSPETCLSNSSSLYTTPQFIQSSVSFESVTVNMADLFLAKDCFVVKDFKPLVWHPPKNA